MCMSTNRFAPLLMDSDDDEEGATPSPPASANSKRKSPCTPKRQLKLGGGATPVPAGYSLIVGTQRPLPPHSTVQTAPIPAVNAMSAASANLGSSNTMPALNTPSFFGRCFQCLYMSHSQKYCPLRMCRACNQYGHSEIVCQKVYGQKVFSQQGHIRQHQNNSARLATLGGGRTSTAAAAPPPPPPPSSSSSPAASGIRVTTNAVGDDDAGEQEFDEDEMLVFTVASAAAVPWPEEDDDDEESCV